MGTFLLGQPQFEDSDRLLLDKVVRDNEAGKFKFLRSVARDG